MTGHDRPPASRIELRVLTSDDWQTWRDIRLQALAQAPYAFGSKLVDWQEAPEERWRERLSIEGGHDVVAFQADIPVGMATGVPGEVAGTAQLISMYVAPDARGLGVAEELLEAVARWAVERGDRSLCLHVRADNPRARRLYERQGFVVTGEVEREAPTDPLELRMCQQLQG